MWRVWHFHASNSITLGVWRDISFTSRGFIARNRVKNSMGCSYRFTRCTNMFIPIIISPWAFTKVLYVVDVDISLAKRRAMSCIGAVPSRQSRSAHDARNASSIRTTHDDARRHTTTHDDARLRPTTHNYKIIEWAIFLCSFTWFLKVSDVLTWTIISDRIWEHV